MSSVVRQISVALALALTGAAARAADSCNTRQYTRYWIARDPAVCLPGILSPPWDDYCCLMQTANCSDGSPSGPLRCLGDGACWDGGSAADISWCPQTDPGVCGPGGVGGPEVCDGIDNNYDGCIDEGCTIGRGQCTCAGSCNGANSCSSPAAATCTPFRSTIKEICGNRADDNCNGLVDEGCTPKAPNSCGAVAGKDPILLFTRSVVTEPFTDFEVQAVARLGLTRTYTSADASLQGGPIGIFGRGWHHEWEATLSCEGEYCTVARGMLARRPAAKPHLRERRDVQRHREPPQ